MKCHSCGMNIKKKPIREEIQGEVRYYCCLGCFEEDLCRRDQPRRAFRTRAEEVARADENHVGG